jgi:5-methylcytosine-specific restriction endonuclease McrA
MTDLSKRAVLVLNAAFEPLNICSAKRALKLIVKGRAKIEESHLQKVHTTKMWDENTGEFILVDLFLPSVIRLMEFKFIPVRSQLLTRKNIFNRDRNTCQYCGRVFSPKNLTLDHILPRAKGGKSTWENLVACCHECNATKGDTLLCDLRNMKLIRNPKSINSHTSKHLLRNQGADDPFWRKYLFFENDVEGNQWTEEKEES